MVFSDQSDVTIVITSCGRFDLLKQTLSSLDLLNTAPIRSVIITEDSGREEVYDCIPDAWSGFVKVIINKEKIGQIKSVDMAYALVETEWIFHCEDDWVFYRPGFIEDSIQALESDPDCLQVWLRSHHHDLAVHNPYIKLGERVCVASLAWYPVISENPDWGVFSFNPGLRRLSDYLDIAPYSAVGGEKSLSKAYKEKGRYSVLLESDAVAHIGWGRHVERSKEGRSKLRRKVVSIAVAVLSFFFGFALGLVA